MITYDADWTEQVRLRDGRAVTLRLLRPDDRDELLRAFDQLSDASRYSRFFTVLSRLSRAQLDYLTQIDQCHHVALVASESTGRGDEGVGLARFIELEPGLAEAALVVADHAQGQGLGTLLMERLCRAARERGIESFQVEFLEENAAVRALLEGISDEVLQVALDPETGTYAGRMPVPAPHEQHHAAWIEALVEAARNLRPAHRLSELKGQARTKRD